MLIRVSDPSFVPGLVRSLQQRVDYVVKQVGDDTIAISVLGSFADGGELELTLFLAAWENAHRGVRAEVVPDHGSGSIFSNR